MIDKQHLIDLKGVSKEFDGTRVLSNIDLYVRRKEFVTLLGPSGCGKTTTLRIIGGFEYPTEGTVLFEGRDITDLPPYKRRVNTVFQKYALFPHLNVQENIAFGLKIAKVPRDEIKKRVDHMLDLVNLSGYGKRSVDQLSGGQQQRIAIARALVNHPEVLLLDEPLGALDLKLRKEMQLELKSMQQRLGITFIYVTHDQEEALAISDRIAVMNKGVIQQIGTPHHIYSRPANVFVATFIGHSNLFHATLSKKDGRTELCFPSGYRLPMTTLSDECTDGQEVVVGIRPEEFSVSSEGLTCDVLNRTFLGRYSNYFLHFADGMCVPDQPSIEFSQDLGHTQTLYQPGDHLTLRPNPDKINVFTADMEKSLLKDVIRYEQA